MNDSRLDFIRTLSTMDETGRDHLLRIETDDELAKLFDVALSNGFSDVAASIEVAAGQ